MSDRMKLAIYAVHPREAAPTAAPAPTSTWRAVLLVWDEHAHGEIRMID
jgi:hypothetical protein